MRKRSAGVAALLGAVLSLLVFTAGAGAAGGEATGDDSVAPSFYTPLGMSSAPVTVIVQVSGKPVAEVEGDLGRKVSDSEKDQIKANLRAAQAPIAAKVAELGGQVENSFQSAYNGLRISIGRDKLSTIESLPNVVGIHALQSYSPDNTNGVPLVLAPAVWDGLNGLHGEGIKVGIIDTGIDYTHADFGGPGTVAAWNDAKAHSTEVANPLLFGPAAPRVKGGTDLVGDDYNAAAAAGSPALIPHPDPNPLDCAGHGSHVAGTAAGDGVLADGSTYNGPYNASTISSHSWTVGPGVAPKADIYAIRVFGCTGSTNVVVDAIDWAVDHNMDVINMSLGAPFGTADNPDSVAATNAAKAGIIVVASAGNSGSGQYITGSPAAGTGALSVAANDPKPSFPGVRLDLSTGQSIVAQNSNGAAVTDGTILGVRVLRNSNGSVSLGCKYPGGGPGADGSNEYTNVAGKLVVTVRGTCARVARAVFAQKAGAAAAAMVNTSTSYPPFEGTITGNPDTGESYPVSIPFLGIRGVLSSSTSDGSKLVAADGGTATLSNVQIANPTYKALADFTSGGPRNGDSALKPEVTAPGVSIVSVGMGTGNGAATLSGTSMAAPHTTGVAALVKQAHPDWSKVSDLKAAIVDTASAAGVSNYSTRLGGAGLIQALPAVQTNVDVVGPANTATLSYGFADKRDDYSRSLTLTLHNHGSSAASFSLSDSNASGSPHSLSFSASSVSVPAGGDASVDVTLNVPVATMGNEDAFRDVAGLVQLTPTSGNNGVTLHVPYYLVPRADSNVNAQAKNQVSSSSPTASVSLSNPGGAIAGTADFYAWGLSDPSDAKGSNDIRAVGVQTFPNPSAADPNRRLLVFAVNGYDRWSTAATNEFDIYVDVDPQNHNGDDYVIAGVDFGAVSTGSFSGQVGASVFSLRSPGASTAFLANAPTDGSTEELPVRTSQLCRTGEPCLSKAASPRFTYHAYGFDLLSDSVDAVDGPAAFNPWAPAISQGDFLSIAPGGSSSDNLTIDPTAWAASPQLGEMVVSLDNNAGKDEAALLALQLR
jgi:minor extracellular serine protease Vpr